MEIALVTTCKGRAQHLKKTLPSNLASNRGAKFILLDYNSPDDLADYVRSTHAPDIESGQLSYYLNPAPEVFNMAHAKNMAHRLGILEGADVLVNQDADNFAKPGFVGYIEALLSRGNVFLSAGNMRGLGKRFRGCSGRIVVTANAFLKAGGYDEQKYGAWGPDDKDFNERLKRLGYECQEIDRQYLETVPHTDGMRFREYPHVKPPESISGDPYELQIAPDGTIANHGCLGMGEVYRNFAEQPITLGKLPTRIFGIGLHKTATSSLDAALKILGYDTAHWESGSWAKQVWNDVRQFGRSPALDRYYAASDIPISILYRELDKGYPGSKFILTTRSEEAWLLSVKRHWSYQYNRFRSDWDKWPISNQMHKAIYGQTNYDAVVFLQRFRRHNAEVIDYFKNRPNDLLVMDMERGAGWNELCTFLGLAQPAVPYPKSFVTEKVGGES